MNLIILRGTLSNILSRRKNSWKAWPNKSCLIPKRLMIKGKQWKGKIKSQELSKKTIKESLEKKVEEYLKDKKYLIVLDDLSSVPEWDMIKDELSPNNGSRIVNRHLKYLGLRGTKIRKLPISLGKLSELETLDIRNTGLIRLPTGLAKLHKLSYLRTGSVHYIDGTSPIGDFIDHTFAITENWQEKFIDKCFPTDKETECCTLDLARMLCIVCCLLPIIPCALLEEIVENKAESRFSGGVRVPRGIGKLWSLNIFGVIHIGGSKRLAKEIQNLTNLRKLAVGGFTKENGKILGKVIDGLKHLRSLVLKTADESELSCCLHSVHSPPKYLRSLKLHGPLGELQKWISSLENLEKIHMRETLLTEEIKAIEKLPNLKILYLFTWTFTGYPELRFGEGTFSMLQLFILDDDVKSVSIEKTALERLEQLKICICMSVREGGVLGLEFLEHLKEMEVLSYYDNESNRESVRNIEEQLKKLPKEPVLRVNKI